MDEERPAGTAMTTVTYTSLSADKTIPVDTAALFPYGMTLSSAYKLSLMADALSPGRIILKNNLNVTASSGEAAITSVGTGLPGFLDLSGVKQTLTINATLRISALVQNGAVAKSGAGMLILSGANTYAGGTTVNAGVLQISHTRGLGTGPVTIGDSRLDLVNPTGQASGSFTINNPLTVSGDATVNTVGGGSYDFPSLAMNAPVLALSSSDSVAATVQINTAPVFTVAPTFRIGYGSRLRLRGFSLGIGMIFVNDGAGTLELDASMSGTLRANAGLLNLNADGSRNLSLSTFGGRFVFKTSQHLNSLYIAGSPSSAPQATIAGAYLDLMSISWVTTPAYANKIDLLNNAMVVRSNDPTAASIPSYIKAKKIMSSANVANKAVGWLYNASLPTPYSTFPCVAPVDTSGTSSGTGSGSATGSGSGGDTTAMSCDTNSGSTGLTGAAYLIRYTLLGDTNLDGVVDAADLANYNSGKASGGSTWLAGDFNYDGVVDGNDCALMKQGNPAIGCT